MGRSRRAWATAAMAALALCAQSAHPAQAPLAMAYAAELRPAALSPAESALVQAVNASQDEDQAALVVDPALCLAAAAHAGQFDKDHVPDTFPDGKGSVRYWLDAAGVSTVFVRAGCAKVKGNAAAEDVLKALRPKLNAKGMTHIGVSSAAVGDDTVVTVIAAARRATLQPVPISPQPDETYRLVARLGPGLQGCRVMIADPDGQASLAAETQSQQLDAELRLGSAAGRYVVELIATTDTGPLLTDVLTLHVGVPFPEPFAQEPPPPRPQTNAPKEPSEPKTPEEMAEALLRNINEIRGRGATLPLRRHDKLTQIALYNSQELRRRQAAKPDTVLADIYVKSQVRYKAYRAAGFVGPQPPNAPNITLARNPMFTHVGIGIVKGKLNGKDALWGTIIFMAER